MSSKWRKAKQALGMKLCISAPAADGDDPPASGRISGTALLSLSPSSHLYRLSRSFSRSSSKKNCSICLATMKPGDGHAIFTAECCHSFHFQCIASNVKHGNQVCPICRAKWKEIPFVGTTLDPSYLGTRQRRMTTPLIDNDLMSVIRRIPTTSPRPNPNRHITHQSFIEPAIFNDDECLDTSSSLKNPSLLDTPKFQQLKIETHPEVPAVPRLGTRDNFTVLIHFKAPVSLQTSRVPVDLVTVLDISGSMAGTKLALLKRAMGFVIQNLGPSDRLSVVAFSSTARRLFSLQRMTETGKQQALQAVNSLTANGGTNIAEGLRKGVKVMEDRKVKNVIASIMLLSDGQDTYTVVTEPNFRMLLPNLYGDDTSVLKVPVHAFGFGTDHDALSMHSIADVSGGTFSFIETEAVIQDAFAQCIGGLLSVVIKDLQVSVECVQPNIYINSLRAGRYQSRFSGDRRMGFIDVGDLYAEEERDFLVSINLAATEITSLLKVTCVYCDPLTKNMVSVEGEEVIIQRPEVVGEEMVSIEVDRQRNRLEAADAMARAKTAAEQGHLSTAANILEDFREILSKSVSAKCNDKLCIALDMELKEMLERMGNRRDYEASGRAYILSGLSSHSWQRATARGDSTHGSSLVHSYQTPSMTEMLIKSQATSTLLATPSSVYRHLSSPKPR